MVTAQELRDITLQLIEKVTEALPPSYTVVMELDSTSYSYSIVRETKWGTSPVFSPAFSEQGQANFLESLVIDINKLRERENLDPIT